MWLTSEAKALCSDARIIPAIQYATQTSIYPPETTAAELTTAQTILISFMYALRQKDLPLIKTLLEVSSAVPQIKSTFLSVWLRDDFCFPRGDVAASLSTLGKLLLDGLQFPWAVAANLASLNVKYCIQECFAEADDTPGQVLLSTMNACVSEGTQADFAKALQSKESQTTLVKHVSFQLPIEKVSKGTQAGLIVNDRGVSVKPEQSTTEVQTTDQSMDTASNHFTLSSHSINSIQKSLQSKESQTTLVKHVSFQLPIEKISKGTQAGLIVYDRGVSVKPEQSTTEVQTTDQSMDIASNHFTLTSHSINSIKKNMENPVLRAGNRNRLQTLDINGYGVLPAVHTKDEEKGVSVQPERSTTAIQSMETTLKPSTFTSHSFNPVQKATDSSGLKDGNGNGPQNLLVNAYRPIPAVQTIAEDHCKSLPTMPHLSHGSLPMPSNNQRKTPSSMNDMNDAFSHLKVIFKSQQTATRIQTTAESKKDSEIRTGTGTHLHTTSATASGCLITPQRKRRTPFSIIDPSTGRDVINDYLRERVEDGAKNVINKTSQGLEIHKEGTISKEMANELLYSAIQKDDTKSIVVAINAGADVNHEGVMKKRPLHIAASAGRIEPAIELIHRSADVDSVDDWGETPLFVASVAGHLLMAEILVSAGANINHMNKERNRPLHVAASAGQREVVRLLLSSGADVDCRGESLRTPLHCAALRGHLSVVGLLLDRGADPMAVEVSGHTPLSLAKVSQQNLVAEFLHYRSQLRT